MRMIAFLPLFFFFMSGAWAVDQDKDPAFRSKLDSMSKRLDQSIAITREQILGNASAPFLPDLYLQLGELLSQKAETLYYVEIERAKAKGLELNSEDAGKAGPVVRSTQDAITVFERISNDFPRFVKRPKALLLLCAAEKSINQLALFKKAAEKLFKEYPETLEAAKARLILGEHFFHIGGLDDSLDILRPLLFSKHVYEKNAAKHRIALVYASQEKFKEALKLFEEIIRDEQLEENSEAKSTSGEFSTGDRANLKRDAMIDSVRAYTSIYPKESEAVKYYSDLAPNEIYFQETIEKLAYRYLTMKEYRTSIKLLRTYSERAKDPERIIKIYVDVLSKIPVEDRATLDTSEMEYVFKQLNTFLTVYQLAPDYRERMENFFEKQLRELGTTNHDLGKSASASRDKDKYLDRASQFYQSYVTWVKLPTYRVKMAMNLADVYFLQNKFAECGQTYLGVASGDFGPPEEGEKALKNAIFCFEKTKKDRYYDQVRNRGLLIRSIRSLVMLNPKLKTDSKLNFSLLKAQYEQGFYEDAITRLYAYISSFKKSKEAVDAGEMILDYYNTRSDIPGIKKALDRLLSLNLPHPQFVERLQTLKQQVALRKLHEKVDVASASGSEASAGKSYLQAALSSGDTTIRDVALKQALATSQREGDIETFFKTATVMASKEPDRSKKGELYAAMAGESVKLTRYYRAVSSWEVNFKETKDELLERIKPYENALEVATLLRDPGLIAKLMSYDLWKSASSDSKTKVLSLCAELLDAPLVIPSSVVSVWAREATQNERLATALFKKADSLRSQLTSSCGGRSGGLVCSWGKMGTVDQEQVKWISEVDKDPGTLEHVEQHAKMLETLNSEYRALEGSGDAHLDTLRMIRLRQVFVAFANFLKRVGDKNPDVKSVLGPKAQEAEESAQKTLEGCKMISQSAGVSNPASKYCAVKGGQFAQFLKWSHPATMKHPGGDPLSAKTVAIQKQIFSKGQSVETMMSVAEVYLNEGQNAHAMAASLVSISAFPDRASDFHALAMCASARLGLMQQAGYHLKNASDHGPWKKQCQGEIRAE